jgi:TonB family protein
VVEIKIIALSGIFILKSFISLCQNDTGIAFEGTIVKVENMPVYKGGEKELIKFIKENLKYPSTGISQKIQGLVYIEFFVDSVGVTSKHAVLRGIREDFDYEAIRVARLIKFSDGAKSNGKYVNVRYVIPIKFEIDK